MGRVNYFNKINIIFLKPETFAWNLSAYKKLAMGLMGVCKEGRNIYELCLIKY